MTSSVGALLNLSTAKARVLVRHADALHTRMPAVGAVLAAGEADWATVELVCSRTELVDDALMARLDAHLAEQLRGWGSWSRKQVILAIDAAVNALDADAAKKRRERAYDERSVRVEVGLDGMATIRARVSARDGAAWESRLTALARNVCPQDPRTTAHRRLDALNALRDGQPLTCRCRRPDCPTRGADAPTPPQAPAGAAVVLHVIAAADTATGHSNAPGYLTGFGVIDAALVQDLAREATRRLVEAPGFDQRQALTYRPNAALARFIRGRDLTCRFPGCSVPAERCDIDHTTPFDHDNPVAGGWTVPWNLACYCREHHRHKTFDTGWRDRQLPDGTIISTSPAGATLRTTPAGATLFPSLLRGQPEEQRRITAARRRLHRHRAASRHNHHRNRAAKEEIRQRCWRNETRRWRVVFHGESTLTKPSKSPYAQFINDPVEPEALPAGWQPAPYDPANPQPADPHPDEPLPF